MRSRSHDSLIDAMAIDRDAYPDSCQCFELYVDGSQLRLRLCRVGDSSAERRSRHVQWRVGVSRGVVVLLDGIGARHHENDGGEPPQKSGSDLAVIAASQYPGRGLD